MCFRYTYELCMFGQAKQKSKKGGAGGTNLGLVVAALLDKSDEADCVVATANISHGAPRVKVR